MRNLGSDTHVATAWINEIDRLADVRLRIHQAEQRLRQHESRIADLKVRGESRESSDRLLEIMVTRLRELRAHEALMKQRIEDFRGGRSGLSDLYGEA